MSAFTNAPMSYHIFMAAIMLGIVISTRVCYMMYKRMMTSFQSLHELAITKFIPWGPTVLTTTRERMEIELRSFILKSFTPAITAMFSFPVLWLIVPIAETDSIILTMSAAAIAWVFMRVFTMSGKLEWFLQQEQQITLARQAAIVEVAQKMLTEIGNILGLDQSEIDAVTSQVGNVLPPVTNNQQQEQKD